MSNIVISKSHYDFLNSALDPKNDSDRLRYFLMTDSQLLITTDGYRMHVVPMKEVQIPGYYTWHKGSESLIKVDDSLVDSRNPMYMTDVLGYPRILSNVDKETPEMIYSCGREKINPFCLEEFPKVTKRKDGKYTIDMGFRKGIVDGESRVICMGINTLPLVWNEDGTVNQLDDDKTLTLDAKFFLDAFTGNVIQSIMRWKGQEDQRYIPVIIGDINDAHAVIMPINTRGR